MTCNLHHSLLGPDLEPMPDNESSEYPQMHIFVKHSLKYCHTF